MPHGVCSALRIFRPACCTAASEPEIDNTLSTGQEDGYSFVYTGVLRPPSTSSAHRDPQTTSSARATFS